ncbi:MAG: hypothetical protein J6K85_03835 [Clostridia bacterium]|nr:hypothetical protein [Clostridia bacterium]
MSEYAIGVFVISAVVGICSHIAYKGKSDPSRLALAIILLCVVVSPIADMTLDGSFVSAEYDESIIGDGYEGVAEQAFGRGILSAVADEFSLDEDNLRVEIDGFDFDKMRAERIRVILSGRAALADNKSIEKYINGLDRGVCECEIEIG